MEPVDLPFVNSLRRLENWNQTLADLERLLDYELQGCFIAEWEHSPAGTVTTTSYGTDLGWIGMMLVHPDYRRRGIASALIQESLDYLNERQVACIKLDATPAGKPVYERLGFRAEWEFQRWERPGELPPSVPINPNQTFITPENDPTIFGTDRSAWLMSLAKGSHVIVREDALGMLRAGSRAAYLGPVIAESQEVAERIIRELVRSVNGAMFWDVPTPNAHAVELAQDLGFHPVRQLLRMWQGSRLIKGDVSRQLPSPIPRRAKISLRRTPPDRAACVGISSSR